MEGEIYNFIKVWIRVYLSLYYCYLIGKFFSKGFKRLIFIIPVILLFLYLPLNLFSPHLGGTTAFFIAWLANFKLILFAFGKGPLSSDPNISPLTFIAVSCLPIKIQKYPYSKSPPNSDNVKNVLIKDTKKKFNDTFLNYAIKGFLVGVMIHAYDYVDHMHPNFTLILYAFHIYFGLEIILAVAAYLARTVLGVELEPQFNEPYLSTSLQDFWGKRWNLVVTSILRPTVYEPTRNIFSRAFNREYAALPAVFATFVVSALMHELMFYYIGRVRPTGDISAFFILHGFCLTVEIALKKLLNGKWQLPGFVSGILTVGFVMSTGFWLFFPNFVELKIDVRAFEDYAAIGAFVENVSKNIVHFLTGN